MTRTVSNEAGSSRRSGPSGQRPSSDGTCVTGTSARGGDRGVRRNRSELVFCLDGVSVGQGGRRVRCRDWEVRSGELWAIVGRNGSGKSTLIRVLAGEQPTSTGDVQYSFPGHPADEILQVDFKVQERLVAHAAGYAQSRWHAGEDSGVRRGGEVLGPALRTVRGRRLIDNLGLARLLDRRVTELSNGERRKLLLARAAASEPSVLVLENPFTGLDQRSRRMLSAAVTRLHRSGISMVLVTSCEEELLSAVTHVLLLDRGRVVTSGRRAAVLAGEPFARVMRPPSVRLHRRACPRRSTRKHLGEPVVELRDVAVRYNDTRILRNIDWVVRRGERWAVVGPNGAGKSALLSLILADNPQAYANEVSLFGRRRGDGDSIWDVRRRLGCVSPELHLFHGRNPSATEVILSGFHDSIGLYRTPSSRQMRLAHQWLRRLGIARCADRPMGFLSEGERQLVLLGRALVKEPELIVLDEPCQGLDPVNRRRFLNVLERVQRGAEKTLLYVTHDREDLPMTMTHALVLRRGRSVIQGAASTVLESYYTHAG